MPTLDQELASRLKAGRWGRAHRHLEQCASTNDEAMNWIEQGAALGALVTADRQSAGRGRMGRSWSSSESEDLYATLILRIPVRPQGIPALSLAVGLALVQALAEAFPQLGAWSLKWPNDLLLNGRKLGGVLCEARWSASEACVAAGFGLNLGRRQFQDSELAQRATSLFLAAQERGVRLPEDLRVETLDAALASLQIWVPLYLEQGFAAISAPYRRWCRELGQWVTLSNQGPDGSKAGTRYLAVDLDEDGALLVQRAPGLRRWRVQSDDVWLVAPDLDPHKNSQEDQQ